MNPRRQTKSRSRKSGAPARGATRRAAADLTYEQMAERYRAEQEESERKMCNLNLFWMDCPGKACRRVRSCAGDPFKCFDGRWGALSEPERQWRRDWMVELHRSKSFEQAVAHAKARAAERDRLAAGRS